ncbi:hypothetical protein GLOIN_2v1877656 [Rhizophagus clarus]|nr:hypothetical protein GLOIN_2v1877656 [Rhizophagus clarus]
MSLVLLNRNWYSTSQDSHARAEWLIYKYGRAHAFFHAIRLGNNFITVEVVQVLLAKGAILSRYLAQRLMIQYGTYDPKLIEMRTKYNNNVDIPTGNPWSSGLSLPVFLKIITEVNNEMKDEIAFRGNDMELFHYLTAGTHAINDAPQTLFKNLQDIEDLILNKKFVPFPFRPRIAPSYRLPSGRTSEHYPSQDGYENNRQINLVSRAILICPDLVRLWKKIGYDEVCSDMNKLVMEGSLIVCFPPNPPNDWVCPNADFIVEKLQGLIKIGFQLTDRVIEDSIRLLESRIKIVGESLLDAFYKILGSSTPEIVKLKLIEIRSSSKS